MSGLLFENNKHAIAKVQENANRRYFIVICRMCLSVAFHAPLLHDYSAAALLAMQSAVIATAIPSVCPSIRHTLVLYPDEWR